MKSPVESSQNQTRELPGSDTLAEDPGAQERSRQLSLSLRRPPGTVAGYQIHRLLGEGAFGSVWLATELATGKSVAIKFYAHRRGLDWTLLNREVEKLAVLYTCRNIVGLIHVGWDADPPYYVMEYLENGSLAQLLESGPLSVADALRLGRGILSALVHAHGSGILHCDLKPGNILLDRHEEARLADFGQSRLSHEAEHALGTLFYMAPEQADLEAVPDARWDVYAFGVVLSQMLTGRVPYRTADAEQKLGAEQDLGQRLEVYRQLLWSSPPTQEHARVAGVDRGLAEIIDRCLARDPAHRFANAQAVLDALDNRTRQMWNRPLLMLGILAPLALLLGIGTLANYAMSSAVRSAQGSLVQRALDSDVIAAKILARSIQRELEDRTAELQKVAVDSRVAEAVLAEGQLPWEQRLTLRRVLDQWKELIDHDREAFGREPDESWFLTDAKGVQIYRHTFSSETMGENYSFRDYFHGRGADYPKGKVPADVKPIAAPYISHPYQSEKDRKYKLAVSVPLIDPKTQQVVAVLGRSMRLGTLLDTFKAEIEQTTGDRVERTIALYHGTIKTGGEETREFKLLDHPWLGTPGGEMLHAVTEAPLKLSDATAGRLTQLLERRGAEEAQDAVNNDRVERFLDPVAEFDPQDYGGEWLAAFSPVGRQNWVAVVQERRDSTLLPVQEMEDRLKRHVRLGLIVCCVLTGGLWYFIYRMLSGQGGRWERRIRRLTGGAPDVGMGSSLRGATPTTGSS